VTGQIVCKVVVGEPTTDTLDNDKISAREERRRIAFATSELLKNVSNRNIKDTFAVQDN
jgi:hypothetical protein